MQNWLLSPPAVFVIVFSFGCLLSFLFSKLAISNKKERTEGMGKSYACGEDVSDHMAQPDYSQFFPFAFFFTIAHVSAMMVATIPLETVKNLLMAEVYIAAVIVGLSILLRR